MLIAIVPGEALRGFTHPAIDLTTGQLIELEPAPEQLDLFHNSSLRLERGRGSTGEERDRP
ncbi:hypothetical protein F3I62_03595 [Pseudomonas sp. R-28-1W-6]|uniref:hypothetical protein n=1 Tax=Pseudomonas sp. R-28-1W-6 TaxID=2650101 RepID=UPI00136609E1|nr:hypothetical protein [Pseudomonas sp. R-28-1W-6]MWV11172.1 hypothetical protein [Pseudomonas sp. R-28-1W-6]